MVFKLCGIAVIPGKTLYAASETTPTRIRTKVSYRISKHFVSEANQDLVDIRTLLGIDYGSGQRRLDHIGG